ncbi:GNAT family N-acetyltransferase [Paenibacillus sp. FSL R10-2734]|uniref:GNAT family N-acetyltransferase n=1 Tax=Paenibacillus sp. FSL R10-2734 TaxID=2954691 RepID=UPI0030D6D930
MNVVNATMEDIRGWLELAAEVESLFGPMVDDPNFTLALEKNIIRQSAFCIRENNGSAGSRLLGGVLFSSSNAPNYKIGWLSVSKQERNKGVATALLNHIIQSIETPSEILVTTFGEDHPEGQPARRFYQKFGFVPMQDGVPNGLEGGSRQNFKLTIAHKDSL